ncbi:hypothetical protein WICPIJ_003813 [Wickerhamomyces pijperi]|uniref:Folylpolyglutamate synthase n=1 Tax=Wickerhamomyces pijperi TaxID=599730 RepID=A0A9P8TNI8_WICPI|nr:hypothetical protein WICPIJ_003813 [Wickerhamomyces pijperi]
MSIPEMVEWGRRIGHNPSDYNKLNIIHVTGTKGKGSTCAFTQGILSQYQGFGLNKIGLYTSPHLKSVRERIRIDGKPIAEDKFTRYFFEVWDKLNSSESDVSKFPLMSEGLKPAYFKYMTLLSFHVFLREGVDTAIYEVGVGGEFDSTNVIQKPTVTGITTLGIDHTFMLGDTIESIAWNKGGIFKAGAKALTVPQSEPGALKVLQERALEKGEQLHIIDQDAAKGLKLGISGEFQAQNAALAIALTNEHLQKLNIAIDQEKTKKGLAETVWPGRCQTIKTDSVTYYIDGAHTKESVIASTSWYNTVTDSNKTRILLFNQQTRDADALVALLHDTLAEGVQFDKAIFTTNITWSSGSYSADLVSMNTSKDAVDKLEVQRQLSNKWGEISPDSQRFVMHDIESSVKLINESVAAGKEVEVFVCGSLHLVGGFLVVLEGED